MEISRAASAHDFIGVQWTGVRWFIDTTVDLLSNIFLHIWRNSYILLVFDTINSSSIQPLKPQLRAAVKNLQTKNREDPRWRRSGWKLYSRPLTAQLEL